MSKKLENLGLVLILGPVAPLVGLMAAWFGAYALLPERWLPFASLAGLLLGVVVDTFLLKWLLARAHHLSLAFWAAVFLFYTVGVFGVFMGVPVFNAALAIPAGFVVGGRLVAGNADRLQVRNAARNTAWFTTGVLALVCTASAFLALISPSTPSDLRGMLGLHFEVTQGMIVGLILVGGVALLAFGWVLAAASVRLAYTFLQRKT